MGVNIPWGFQEGGDPPLTLQGLHPFPTALSLAQRSSLETKVFGGTVGTKDVFFVPSQKCSYGVLSICQELTADDRGG